jgi:hypothetical protein
MKMVVIWDAALCSLGEVDSAANSTDKKATILEKL